MQDGVLQQQRQWLAHVTVYLVPTLRLEILIKVIIKRDQVNVKSLRIISHYTYTLAHMHTATPYSSSFGFMLVRRQLTFYDGSVWGGCYSSFRMRMQRRRYSFVSYYTFVRSSCMGKCLHFYTVYVRQPFPKMSRKACVVHHFAPSPSLVFKLFCKTTKTHFIMWLKRCYRVS